MAGRDLHSTWARLLVRSLADAGARDIVSSPGARSTPLLIAALAHPDLTVHSIIDERSAAFFAVGQAKVTGRASVLLCTSGSAGAHYYPALVEASEAGVPVIAITADRPRELQGNKAPQTIDQTNLYGRFARDYFDAGMPDGTEDALRALRRKAAQSWSRAHGAKPGPVQINAPFRKPLEPREPNDEGRALRKLADEIAREPVVRAERPEARAHPDAVARLAEKVRRAERGVIACGPGALANGGARNALYALATRLGWPVLAESTSQFRFTGEASETRIDFFDTVLRSDEFRARMKPDLVLSIGGTLTSMAWPLYRAAHPEAFLAVLAEHDWSDASNRAGEIVFGPVAQTIDSLAHALSAQDAGAHADRNATDPSWLASWKRADAHAAGALADRFESDAPLTEGALTHHLVRSLPAGSLLALGNSLPVRDVDWYAQGAARDLAVWSQRGANGIDGLLSGAAGAASQWPGRTALLVGDVSLLHDLHGILTAVHAPKPLTVVVPVNGGGRIFDLLPLARTGAVPAEAFLYWTTPREPDFAGLARSLGATCLPVDTVSSLEKALTESTELPGCTMIIASIAPRTVAAEQEEIRAAATQAIDRDHA
ncbi:MAG: 2-succinyl-5-enolpyruvyl-6-hydroxy-3-cyclohexene-1-carboxylic-acid synthase [Gemmatimonadetes bacterium]|nr:2-succinyl-5-enolpyruvyl-6-hydroxy-3-cyclohexene-1-carboxylic-acid synthase [Gemmatimonadota bacterium]